MDYKVCIVRELGDISYKAASDKNYNSHITTKNIGYNQFDLEIIANFDHVRVDCFSTTITLTWKLN